MMGAYRALSGTLFFLGDFEFAREYAMRGLQIWHTRGAECQAEEITAHPVACLFYEPFASGISASSLRAKRARQKLSR